MAITVKHTKVSTIPDGDDTSVVRPSDWNADHQLVGTVPVANGGTGAATLTGYVKGNGTSTMTASSTIPNTDITGLGTASTKDAGVANGVATLDSGGQVPLSQIPPLGDLNYQGTWNATTNTPTLTSSVGTKGYYYVVSVAGTTNLNGITDWQISDWAVFNGSVWQKIDNTDAVTSVNGQTGAVNITLSGLGAGTIATQNANAVAITGGSINGTTIGASTQADITGNTISAYTKFVSQDYYAQSVLGGNLRTSGGTSLLNWDGGGSGNVTVNGGLVVDPANKNINMSPTGTGSVTIAPATTGAMDNMVIGATTPKAITGTTITATTFSGSGASLTSIPNSALVNSAITINGVSTSLGGSVSVGTVTSVTATAPVASTGGTTPVISMPAATTSVSGYLTSTDWNIFNNKGSGTVTSVTATSPVTSTGGTTPVIAIPAATGSVNGYLTSTDWTTFNNKSNTNGTVTSVAALTIGTTGTDLSSTVATGTTTPVITLQVPTASATNRGALSAADWSTFNSKAPAVTYTTNYIPYGQGTTTPLQSANHTFDGTNLTLGNAGVSARFQGDFSNATVASRTSFVTGTTNGSTGIYALPNGTSTAASWQATNAADPTNASKVLIATNASTDVQLVSGINGTGTYLPLAFYNGGLGRFVVGTSGQFGIGPTATVSYGTSGQVLTSGGASSAPTWATPTATVASGAIYENTQTITANYTITSGSNAMSAGPITINTGVTVTVPTGSTWVVV